LGVADHVAATLCASDRKIRLLAVAPHPIQYHAPLFRALACTSVIDFEVAYIELLDARRQGQGFGVPFAWDLPLMEGYRWRVLQSRGLGTGRFRRWVIDPETSLGELAPDVVFITGWQSVALIQVLLAAASRSIRVVMRGESNALKRRGALTRRAHRWLLRRVDAFLVIGKSNRDFYASYGIPSERLFEAPYFVDNDRFVAASAQWRDHRQEIRAQLGIAPHAVCFLYAGKFEAKKRPEHLVEALVRVRRARPDLPVHGLFVGTGAREGPLRLLASREAAPVSFGGFLNQTQMPRAYIAADALVLPSDYGETWGLVVNEAMACGLPALVSDRVGCGPDLVESGVTGQRYPFGDIAAMAATIEHWATEPGMIAALGRSAEQRVRSDYTVERTAMATLDAALAVTGARARTP
jgi:glycosyltransferase involved in cell wall biosynthesis